MKRVLLASAALVFTAGFAAAEVTVGGNGRMGIIYSPSDDDGDHVWNFTSRIRIVFTASGETDGGLTFGGTIRADNAGGHGCIDFIAGDCGSLISSGGVTGAAGSVYISGAFGKLSLGDVDSAAQAAVGQVSGVGLTGLGDLHEISYLGAGSSAGDPVMLYEYSAGDLTFYASLSDGESAAGGFGTPRDPAGVGSTVQTWGLGVKYGMGNYTVAAGYEAANEEGFDASQIALGASAGFGDATVKAVYSMNDADGFEWNEYAVSLDYAFGATTVTAFYHGFHSDESDDEDDAVYGLGASYDLGGGAALKGGIVSCDGCDDPIADFGVSMTF